MLILLLLSAVVLIAMLCIRFTANDDIKGAWTYCIINKWDQQAAKECNRKLYCRQKLKKLFSVRLRMGL